MRGDGECYLAAVFSETPLHTAASMGYSQCVQLLLKFGAGIEILMGTMKMSALHLAAQEGEWNIKSKYYRKRFKYHLKCYPSICAFIQFLKTIFYILSN